MSEDRTTRIDLRQLAEMAELEKQRRMHDPAPKPEPTEQIASLEDFEQLALATFLEQARSAAAQTGITYWLTDPNDTAEKADRLKDAHERRRHVGILERLIAEGIPELPPVEAASLEVARLMPDVPRPGPDAG